MLAELFFTFAKIGLFTFGGGYAMIAQIKETVVEQKGWLDEEELMQIITVAESTPGPIAINMATYVGYKKKGVAGSVMATLGVVVPSLVILYIVSLFLDAFLQIKRMIRMFLIWLLQVECKCSILVIICGFKHQKAVPTFLPMKVWIETETGNLK